MKLVDKALQKMLWYMEMRQGMYLRRLAGEPFPWTKDPILRDYRLENVFRELDRVTVWIRENWREPYRKHPNLWLAMALARGINWPDTLAEIGFPERWNPPHVLDVLEKRLARGLKTFTSVYRLQHHGEGSKARYLVNRVLTPLWRAVEEGNRPPWEAAEPCTLETAHRWLSQFYGFGMPGFLAYEVVTDWRHTRYLRHAPDICTWANPGPGATRGLCRLLEVDLDAKIPVQEQLRYMREVYRWVREHRDRAILPTLEMRDVEHSLCAYDKWCRAHESLRAGKRVTLERFSPPQSPRRNLFAETIPPQGRSAQSRILGLGSLSEAGRFRGLPTQG